MKLKQVALVIVLLCQTRILSQSTLPDREIHYRPGDWVSYSVFRNITSMTHGNEYVYFGTTHGILRNKFYQNMWDTPFTYSDGLTDDNIRDVVYDTNSGFLWCATGAGVSYRIPASEEWRNVDSGLAGMGNVRKLGMGDQYVWVQTSDGYYYSDRTTGTFWHSEESESIKDQVVWSITDDFESYFMNYQLPHGYLRTADNRLQDPEFRVADFTQSLQDKAFNVWIGTSGLGLMQADMQSIALNPIIRGLWSADVQAMAWDEDGMWIGGNSSRNNGISYWNQTDDIWQHFEARLLPQLRSDAVNSIAADGRYIWFGTEDGLARYDKKQDAWRTFSTFDNLWSDQVLSVSLTDSVLWVGTRYGINRITDNGGMIQRIGDERLVHREILQLEADSGDVWACTSVGIYHYYNKTGQWVYLDGAENILSSVITAVSVYNNEVWFATSDGVEMYDKKTDSWKGFLPAHYPTGDYTYTILADQNDVWFGTDKGVLKYVKAEDRWKRFTVEDGLLHNNIHWMLLDGDYIWLGTPRGLTQFYWNSPCRID